MSREKMAYRAPCTEAQDEMSQCILCGPALLGKKGCRSERKGVYLIHGITFMGLYPCG